MVAVIHGNHKGLWKVDYGTQMGVGMGVGYRFRYSAGDLAGDFEKRDFGADRQRLYRPRLLSEQ